MTHQKPWWGMAAIFFAAALDASFLPFPVTTMFVAFSVTRPHLTTHFAITAVAGTMTGAVTGYLAGRYIWLSPGGEFTPFATLIFERIPGFSADGYDRFRILYNKWDIGVIIISSATALPFGVISVSAGLFNLPPILFLAAALTGQTAKYLVVAFLCHRYGSRVLQMLRFNWKPWLISFAMLLAVVAFVSKLAP